MRRWTLVFVVAVVASWPAPAQTAPITCGAYPATLVGSMGNDVLVGTRRDDVIQARGGNDVIRGLGGHDAVCSGSGSDLVYGGAGDDWLLGGVGFGRDTLIGGPGADILRGGRGDDILLGRAGNDELEGWSESDLLRGGWGRDLLFDGRGDDVVFGGLGPDTFYLAGGDDFYSSGGGGDTIMHTERQLPKSVSIDLSRGQAEGTVIGSDRLVGPWAWLYGTYFADVLIGDASANSIDGEEEFGGQDHIEGRAGDDTLYGGEHSYLDGGDGHDTCWFGADLLSCEVTKP